MASEWINVKGVDWNTAKLVTLSKEDIQNFRDSGKDRTIIVLETKGRWSNVKTAENGESRQSLWSDFQSTALSSLQGDSLVLKNKDSK